MLAHQLVMSQFARLLATMRPKASDIKVGQLVKLIWILICSMEQNIHPNKQELIDRAHEFFAEVEDLEANSTVLMHHQVSNV